MAYVAAADVPAGNSAASKAAILALVRDAYSIKSVANLTERAQAVTDWPTKTGAAIGVGNPVMVWRQDLNQIEVSEDGSAWHQFANTTDTGWLTLTMASGWTANSAVQYRRIGNRVYVRGLIRDDDGVIAAGTYTSATLAAGYRPGADQYWPAVGWVYGGTDAFAEVYVTTAGALAVIVYGNTTGVRVAFDFLTD
jgi:hypothetical protein